MSRTFRATMLAGVSLLSIATENFPLLLIENFSL